MKHFLIIISLMLANHLFAEVNFYQHWGDGRAEVSSYDVLHRKYGELREGYAVLIYVTEDINKNTYVKIESPTSEKDKMGALKLNRILRYNTGIYDYSIMASVFCEVDAPEWPFAMRKITLTAQDWCGHVFEEIELRNSTIIGQVNSYFEGKSREYYTIPVTENLVTGDGLLIRIRELNGKWMQPGQSISVSFLPRLSGNSLRAPIVANLSKEEISELRTDSESILTHIWRLQAEDFWEKYWVEQSYPHRIIAWEFSDGSRAQLKKTLRVSYWTLNGIDGNKLRMELDIGP